MGNSLRNDKRVSCKRYSIVGVNDDEGPPVPIPNTVVKLISAENTWREAAREDRSAPTYIFSSIAQSVEHAAVNRRVVGSSPTGGAKIGKRKSACRFYLFTIHSSLDTGADLW